MNLKRIFPLLLIIFILFYTKNINVEENLIPDDAIRFRVIANSNTVYDQNIKIQIRNEVQNKIFELTKDSNTIEETREILKSNISFINNVVENKLKELSYDKSFSINYGLNPFPEKKYKGVKYKAGDYESLVITLGEGTGDNWWCVLFPPLCLIESEDESLSSEVEYKSYIKEIINKYF